MTAIMRQYGSVIYRLADQSSEASLRKLLRENDMQSWVSLSFQREPDYFAGENLMGPSYSVIVYQNHEPHKAMGMYSCTYLPVKVDGQKELVGYLGHLRISRTSRHHLRYVKYGYDSIQHLIPGQGTRDIWFTSIATDNKPAHRLLEAGLTGLPKYIPMGNVLTMAIATSQGRDTEILHSLKPSELNELVHFYNRVTSDYEFSPWLSEEWLSHLDGKKGLSLDDFFVMRDQGKIIGCVALWDQRPFKQTVIHAYAGALKHGRVFYNIFARLTHRPLLPAPGESLQSIFLSFLACDPEHTQSLAPMIQHALFKLRQRHAQAGIFGLSTENPLLPILMSRFTMQTYETCIERVDWSRTDCSQLTARPVQPEVAVL